jgi:hypothetical protein
VNHRPDGVDCVVRLHDPSRLMELDRCVFSLVSQERQPVRILLVTQRFSNEEQRQVHERLAPLLAGAPNCQLELLNYEATEPSDARTALLNLGLSASRNRYLGFLDYDDLLYPEAYRMLVEALERSRAAIAFAGIRVLEVDVHATWVHSRRLRQAGFAGSGLLDLFTSNFCPIHSYLIDRRWVPDSDLWFDPELTIEEDYDLLLRLCARYASDFSLLGCCLGDYLFKSDGSNTIHAARPGRQRFDYDWVKAQLEVSRQTTVLSASVRESLGLPEGRGSWTIRRALDAIEFSRPPLLPPEPEPAGT